MATETGSPKKDTQKGVILISTPWPLYSRPSIQLGVLKAYLKSRFPELRIDAHHVYLKLAESIGYQPYHDISERTWLAETIYAALLFPERIAKIEKLFQREAAGKSRLKILGFRALADRVKKISESYIKGINWAAFALAGFSISLCQLTSALYFIKRIKQDHPHLTIVVGGSTFTAEASDRLFDLFDEIDVLVTGEGELPLSRLIGHHVINARSIATLAPTPSIFTRDSTGDNQRSNSFYQMQRLDTLPPPDYDDFFKLLASFDVRKLFFPTLPVEISRGCWWQRASDSGKASGCAFCNLNRQWSGYRSKNPDQAVEEIDGLTRKYQSLSVAIVDNVLPRKNSGDIFEKLAALEKDFHLFGEIRAATTWRELNIMVDAGLRKVQIGIESLSSRLLRKLHKGTTAIQNLEIMKNCEALGLVNISNLILQFPGSDEQDVCETLQNIAFALPYRPLRCVDFWLGLGSPVWQNPKAFGVKAVFNHPKWAYLLPQPIYRSLPLMIQAYRGDLRFQRKLWRPVKKKLTTWEKAYVELRKENSHAPILSFRDGRDFLIINQRRLRSEPLTHRLVATSREIYLFCQHHRSLKRIRARFPAFAEDKIAAFLKMMVAKKLMFAEDDKYLSLAVPVRPEKVSLVSECRNSGT